MKIPLSLRCMFQKCPKKGEQHKWGYGFRFCEKHMPLFKKMERGRLPNSGSNYPYGICTKCTARKPLKGDKMCTQCYNETHAVRNRNYQTA